MLPPLSRSVPSRRLPPPSLVGVTFFKEAVTVLRSMVPASSIAVAVPAPSPVRPLRMRDAVWWRACCVTCAWTIQRPNEHPGRGLSASLNGKRRLTSCAQRRCPASHRPADGLCGASMIESDHPHAHRAVSGLLCAVRFVSH